MKNGSFTLDWKAVREYSAEGAVLLAYMNDLALDSEGWITVSDRQIREDLGFCHRVLRRALRRLVQAGILEMRREPRKTPRYRFTHDNEQALPYWQELIRVYPERHEPHHLAEAYLVFCKLVREGEDPRRIVQAAKIYRLEQDARTKRRGQGTGTKYVKELSNWLKDRLYLKYFTDGASMPTTPNGLPEGLPSANGLAKSQQSVNGLPKGQQQAEPTHEPEQEPVPTQIIPHTNGHAKTNGDAPPIAVSRADEVLIRLGIDPSIYKRS